MRTSHANDENLTADIQTLLGIITAADKTGKIESAFELAGMFRNFTYCQLTNEQQAELQYITESHSKFIFERTDEWSNNCYRVLYPNEPDFCDNNCGSTTTFW